MYDGHVHLPELAHCSIADDQIVRAPYLLQSRVEVKKMSPRGSTRRPVSPVSVPTHGAMAGDARPNEFETTSAQKRFFRRNALCGIACQNERLRAQELEEGPID